MTRDVTELRGRGPAVLTGGRAAAPAAATFGGYFQAGSLASFSAIRSWKLLRCRACSMSVTTWLSG
jgi:hypothetical protein